MLGLTDGSGAIAVSAPGAATGGGTAGTAGTAGTIELVAVLPSAQGEGRGRALVAGAEAWLRAQGAGAVEVGSSGPFHLWPGIDVTRTRALCLFESGGYEPAGIAVHLSCPTTFRARTPQGVTLRRALDDAEAGAALALARGWWPSWEPEVARALEHGSCLIAVADPAGGEAVGTVCHSVNRTGWVGPLGVAPRWQRRGVGAALLSEACKDLMIAGLTTATIADDRPLEFFARTARAAVHKVYRRLRLPLA